MIWVFLSILCICLVIFVLAAFSFVKQTEKPEYDIKALRTIAAQKLLAADSLITKGKAEMALKLLQESATYVQKHPELELYFPIVENNGKYEAVLAGLTHNKLENWASGRDCLYE